VVGTLLLSRAGWLSFGSGLSYAVVAASSIGGLLLADYSGGLLQGIGEVTAGMWVRQAVGIGWSIVAICLLLAGVSDPMPILAGMAGWAWACAGAGCVMVVRRPSAAPRVTGVWLGRLTIVGARTQVIFILLMLNYRLDMALLAALGSVADVGVYSIAVGFSELAWFGVNALGAVLLPHLASAGEGVAATRTASAIRLSIGSTAVLSGLVALGLWVAAVPLFGAGFQQSTAAFVALAPGLVAFAGFKILATYSIAIRCTRPITLMALGGVVLNVAANLLLIPRFGSVGAALSSSVSYGVVSILATVWFSRRSGLGLSDTFVPAPSDFLVMASIGRGPREAPRGD
jgi:O-antigen/teichoic acid export membrane protein